MCKILAELPALIASDTSRVAAGAELGRSEDALYRALKRIGLTYQQLENVFSDQDDEAAVRDLLLRSARAHGFVVEAT